jgi:hypothetical protein
MGSLTELEKYKKGELNECSMSLLRQRKHDS